MRPGRLRPRLSPVAGSLHVAEVVALPGDEGVQIGVLRLPVTAERVREGWWTSANFPWVRGRTAAVHPLNLIVWGIDQRGDALHSRGILDDLGKPLLGSSSPCDAGRNLVRPLECSRVLRR